MYGMTVVTDEMLQAARRMMPARWSMDDLGNAIAAAIEAAPLLELAFQPAMTLTPEQEAEQQSRWDECMREFNATPPGAQRFRVSTPTLHPALDHPLILGGITEIGQRLEAARSTVVGWTKRADKIGMPAPIAELAAGPVDDLTAVETWYRAWKADDGGETIGDNGGGG
jgi:hypothetical protein